MFLLDRMAACLLIAEHVSEDFRYARPYSRLISDCSRGCIASSGTETIVNFFMSSYEWTQIFVVDLNSG